MPKLLSVLISLADKTKTILSKSQVTITTTIFVFDDKVRNYRSCFLSSIINKSLPPTNQFTS